MRFLTSLVLVAALAGLFAVAPGAPLPGAHGQAAPADEEPETPIAGGETEDETGETPEGEARPAEAEPETLRVGVAGSPPFVVEESGNLTGMSVELWRLIAVEQGWRFELVPFTNAEAAIQALENDELEAAIGPLSITSEREGRVDFTQPYAQGAFAIAAPAGSAGIMSTIQPFLTTAFLSGAGIFLLILALVGTLFWVAERRANPEQFPVGAVHGIGNGVWLALVTMTTVGYGDRAPVTPAGRVIAGVWMMISLVLASSLTAFLATALTILGLEQSSIRTAEELSGKTVATVEGTSAVPFLRSYGARVLQAPTLSDAIDRVEAGDAVAIAFDRPTLHHELTERPEVDLTLSEATYEPLGYGFAFPKSRPNLRSAANITLLELAESERLARLERAWLGE